MELSTAIDLIKTGVKQPATPQHWVDLGAGDGLFTRALGSLLPSGSSVLAVDRRRVIMKWNIEGVSLKTLAGDFEALNWGDNLEGILMANSLHYVRDQAGFLLKLRENLTSMGRAIVIEYERRQPNTWVPYPINFVKLRETAEQARFSTVKKLSEVPSTFDDVTIYSALLMK